MISEKTLDKILRERCDRFQQLIEEGRYEDALSIGEEFDEWIAVCQSWQTE
jgi:hypothetical protein